MKLYHKDIYFPSYFDKDIFLSNINHIRVTEHFKDRVWHKKLPIPTLSALRSGVVFEICVIDGVVAKACFRIHIANTHKDIIYVVNRLGIVVTGWWQSSSDKHSTLNREKYSKS